jgi:two-component system chemotaxis sensor kinase CheA
MGEISNNSSSAGIDLSQFYQVFFEEAGENLELMEQKLLELNVDAADDEEMNAIFRCAHSVKGGAATFGFSDVAALTHQMETLLDKLRRHELTPTSAMVDVLLAAGDALKEQLAVHQGSASTAPDTSELLARIRAMAEGQAPVAVVKAATVAAPVSSTLKSMPVPKATTRAIELVVGPLEKPETADARKSRTWARSNPWTADAPRTACAASAW